MTSKGILTVALTAIGAAVVFAQAEPPRLPPPAPNAPAPSLQSAVDPGYAALIATCKTPPPAAEAARAVPREAARRGRGPQAPQGTAEYSVTEIPGVIAAGQKWKFMWQQAGNNGDGIVGLNDGGLLLAQNDSSAVVKLDKNGKTSVAYSDTHTGGALSMSPKGDLFIVERGLHARDRAARAAAASVLANSYQRRSDRLHRRRDQRPHGRQQGRRLLHDGRRLLRQTRRAWSPSTARPTTNGIILSADEKTLYVTNGPTLAAFDVQADGSLTNQREFAKLRGAAAATAARSTRRGASTSRPAPASR